MSERVPRPQKMWATYNFDVVWGVGYTRKQSRDDALSNGGWRPDEWPKVKSHFQSYRVTVAVRDA